MATKKAVGKPMTGKQASAVADFLKNKGAKAAPVDAEDQLDGGVDEDKE